MSYHNTQGLEDTAEYERKALTQEQMIMAFFEHHGLGELFSPSEVNNIVLPNAPLTSVRRAMSDLTREGLLIKTEHITDGPYGRPEGLWRLAAPVQKELL